MKNPVYIRYEFSNKSGKPEGGDIFQFSSMSEIQEMEAEILQVTQSDQVAVNLTIGHEKPFFGFLKNVGMSRKDAEKEIVDPDLAPVQSPKKQTKKKAKKPTASKTIKKTR